MSSHLRVKFVVDKLFDADSNQMVNLPAVISEELHPDSSSIYSLTTKWVGSSLVLTIDNSGAMSYRQLQFFVERLLRKSKVSIFNTIFTDILSSPDISTFEQRLYDTQTMDDLFVTVKRYLLAIIAYYRAGGTDVRFLNVKNISEMSTLITTIDELTFVETFLSSSSRNARSPMLVSMIAETYRELITMPLDEIVTYIQTHTDDIRSNVATFYASTIGDQSSVQL